MRLAFVLVALALFPACKKSAANAPAGKSELVSKLDALADKVCACKDLACADAAAAELADVAAHTASVADDDVAPAQAAQARFDGCHAAQNPVVTDYKAIMTDVCACKDKACATKDAAKVEAWSKALKTSGKKLAQGDAQVLIAAGKTGADCFTKLGVAIPK